MPRPARLDGGLLARKGQALPTSAADPRLASSQPDAVSAALGQARRGAPVGATARRPDSDRMALTLRLDRERYTRLKIVAARHAQSGQSVLVKALDAYLATCGAECACLPTSIAASAVDECGRLPRAAGHTRPSAGRAAQPPV
jgi:hypothetical protein